jgi:hypothetical protein
MNKAINQKISCFVDNELNTVDTISLLKNWQSHPELKHQVNHYQTVSYALSDKKWLPIKADFLTTIQQKIATEPHYLLPKRTPKKICKAFMALAACLALIALLATGFIYDQPIKFNTFSTRMIAVINKQLNIETIDAVKKRAKSSSKPQSVTTQNNHFNEDSTHQI